MEPRVSFVVTNYNYGRYLGHALDSLLTQNFHDLEIIVVDDRSTDNSAEVLATYAGDPRVRIVRHTENEGSIRSYNQGLGMARGEFVGVFDADDYAKIDAGFASHLTGYRNGDFNFSGGSPNSDDYFQIDRAFHNQGAALSSAAAPQPTVAFAASSTIASPTPTKKAAKKSAKLAAASVDTEISTMAQKPKKKHWSDRFMY